ncbi:hypothetical protein [Streptomyces sp. NPDC060001]|uniref:hypothetical protein n=1 Tax=Streptomyces sp. NPDC060001 TaxID=3347032 RepID=UPI0036B88D35
MATEYRVKYKILPPGVGPDDYEPADLDGGEILLDLSDPDPAGFVGDHLISYGPPHSEVEKALAPHLPAGATPIILHVTKT